MYNRFHTFYAGKLYFCRSWTNESCITLVNFYNRLVTKKAGKLVFWYMLLNMPQVLMKLDELMVWVLSFQKIFRFVQQYWCYKLISFERDAFKCNVWMIKVPLNSSCCTRRNNAQKRYFKTHSLKVQITSVWWPPSTH